MRRVSFAHSFTFVLILAALSAAPARAQMAADEHMGKDEIASFAKVEVAISVARDSTQAQLAMARNKTVALQQQLRDKLQMQIEGILHQAGMSDDEYRRKTFIVSTDSSARRTFDVLVAQITGVPTPGQVPVVASAPTVKVPPGPVGVHLGHVLNAFGDTPNGQGLLPTALAEAKTAAQHAALAARAPTNLDAMKLHAGHVINAIDPTIVTAGPGLGYGVKRAALNIATHVELAAKTPGASPNVITHANHVATAARSTAARCDQAIAVAKQIQAATSATEAAALVNQLVSLTDQLTTGFDANGDGKITWQEGEGGLQQAQEHMMLLLAGEGIAP